MKQVVRVEVCTTGKDKIIENLTEEFDFLKAALANGSIVNGNLAFEHNIKLCVNETNAKSAAETHYVYQLDFKYSVSVKLIFMESRLFPSPYY